MAGSNREGIRTVGRHTKLMWGSTVMCLARWANSRVLFDSVGEGSSSC